MYIYMYMYITTAGGGTGRENLVFLHFGEIADGGKPSIFELPGLLINGLCQIIWVCRIVWGGDFRSTKHRVLC